MVLDPGILPDEAKALPDAIRTCISSGILVYYSFAAAANVINLVLNHADKHPKRP
jgi:hypothetical protein